LSATHPRELRGGPDLNDSQEAPQIVSYTLELFHWPLGDSTWKGLRVCKTYLT
jgi:hypothetical protein